MTEADIARWIKVAEVSAAVGFDAMAKALRDAGERAKRRALLAMHRRVAGRG